MRLLQRCRDKPARQVADVGGCLFPKGNPRRSARPQKYASRPGTNKEYGMVTVLDCMITHTVRPSGTHNVEFVVRFTAAMRSFCEPFFAVPVTRLVAMFRNISQSSFAPISSSSPSPSPTSLATVRNFAHPQIYDRSCLRSIEHFRPRVVR